MILCKCGCGEAIIIKRHHRCRGIPEYIWGHSWRGKQHSEESKKKISESNSGKNHPMYGKHFSEEHKKRLSESQKGKIVSNETKKRLSEVNKGKHPSEETRKKMSEAHKNPSEETRKKMSQSEIGEKNPFYGKHHTEETKIKISKSNKGQLKGDKNPSKRLEVREKLSQILRGDGNGNWRGGISFEPYCFKFNKQLKSKIRGRDNYQCQNPNCLCNQLQSLLLYGRILTVHHIHYDKLNCDPDLISLCQSCNIKANFNRDYWEELFMNILIKRGLCKPLSV